VSGDPPPETGQWHDYLRKIQAEARSEIANADTPEAKSASLRYSRLGQTERFALLRLEPLTGRMHQLRLQCASRGYPITGDELYGAREVFGPPNEVARDRGIALHALDLTILHPIKYEPITITAPLPDYWPEWARKLLR
jgi:23S rRNA pseudouridine1911/1915/1917 synthase